MKFKIDLHTHSILSYDGGITRDDYVSVLSSGKLDCIAITDHNEIDLALEMASSFPQKIIAGEEIMTKEGEIIGLFLKKLIPKGLSIDRTIELIKEQKGVVYLPHPFDIMRAGIGKNTASKFVNDIDIIEVFNARGKLAIFDKKALNFAVTNNMVKAASTDAHIGITLGKAYNVIENIPTRVSLCDLLKKSMRVEFYAGSLREKFAPTLNVLRRKFFHK